MAEPFEPKVKVEAGRSSGAVALLSAAIASVCCVLPPVLTVVGLGSLGAGSFLGRWAVPVLAAAVALLAAAWWAYLREARKLRAIAAPMKNERRTRASLAVASAVIGAMAGLQVYPRGLVALERAVATAAETRMPAGGAAVAAPPPGLARLEIPVEGMDCVTCEIPIEGALRALEGVREAEASIATNSVTVTFDPSLVTVDALVAAVNSTGYRARPPRAAPATAPSTQPATAPATQPATRPAECCALPGAAKTDDCCPPKEETR